MKKQSSLAGKRYANYQTSFNRKDTIIKLLEIAAASIIVIMICAGLYDAYNN
ncbi:hypothetical protein [Flavobacterium subsaxonicum]|uniref:hypothetical protein n=1 Tax=Flavobacterium subsaxonicum TaxID=426226 RepID=UPI00041E1E61|nr:hypothetical protein [Flavobacterium subsaxonicum]